VYVAWDNDPDHDYSVGSYLKNTTGDDFGEFRRRNLDIGWNY
jgi:hypothetical protein